MNFDTGKKSTFIMYAIIMVLSLFGGSVFGIRVAGLTLSLYRIALLLSLIFVIMEMKIKLPSFGDNSGKKYLCFLVFWLFYSMMQLILVKDITSYIKYMLVLFSAMYLTYIGMNWITNGDMFKSLILYLSLACMIIHIWALYEVFTGSYAFLTEPRIILLYSYTKNLFGMSIPILFFANPNNYAFFCVISATILLIGFYISKKSWQKTICIIGLLLNAFNMLATDSRSGILSLLALYIILLISKRMYNFRIKFLVLCIFGLAGVLFLIEYKGISFGSDSVDWLRVQLIIGALRALFEKTFGFGVGVGNVEIQIGYYMDTYASASVHNWFIEVLTAGGIFVFVLYIIVYSRLLFDTMTLAQNEKKEVRNISRCFLSFLIAFIIISIGPSSMFELDFLWAIFALLCIFINICAKSNKNSLAW